MKIVGIVNLTPDSFSEDGIHANKEHTIKHVLKAVQNGADILDIGAESTNPKSKALTPEEEWERLKEILPDILSICRDYNVEVSLDTRFSSTAKNGLKLGINYVNDVSGGEDPLMFQVISDYDVKYIMMHNRGIPEDRSLPLPSNINIFPDLFGFFERRICGAIYNGILKQNIILDPGIGFGKSADQSFYVIKNINKLKIFGLPILVGHSRKSFINKVTKLPFNERDIETLSLSSFLLSNRIEYIRVHNVEIHSRMLKVLNMLHNDL
ncbi:MAG: dihydropteroate synthase [Sphingobacteriia bacterium]|nr:dihydropteroate synthase [Sphingobacteriia bacterium]